MMYAASPRGSAPLIASSSLPRAPPVTQKTYFKEAPAKPTHSNYAISDPFSSPLSPQAPGYYVPPPPPQAVQSSSFAYPPPPPPRGPPPSVLLPVGQFLSFSSPPPPVGSRGPPPAVTSYNAPPPGGRGAPPVGSRGLPAGGRGALPNHLPAFDSFAVSAPPSTSLFDDDNDDLKASIPFPSPPSRASSALPSQPPSLESYLLDMAFGEASSAAPPDLDLFTSLSPTSSSIKNDMMFLDSAPPLAPQSFAPPLQPFVSPASFNLPPPPNSLKLKDIVLKQKAGGNFPVDILTIFGKITLEKLRQQIPREISKGEASILDQIMVTFFVCRILEVRFQDQQSQWDLVVKKAMVWLRREVKKIAGDSAEINWSSLIPQNILNDVVV